MDDGQVMPVTHSPIVMHTLIRRAKQAIKDVWYALAPAALTPPAVLWWHVRRHRTRDAFPTRIFQTWKSTTEIPAGMRYWSNSWRSLNPDFSYELWDDHHNRDFIATKFPWFLPTYDGYEREIMRADAVRYFYLYEYGGIYADMDFECLKPIQSLLTKFARYDVILGSIEGDALGYSHTIPNAIMVSKPKADFWLTVFDLLMRYGKDTRRSVEEKTGPVMLGDAWRSYGLLKKHFQLRVLPPATFYPISWLTADGQQERQQTLRRENFEELTRDMKARYPEAVAITYWTYTWKQSAEH